MKKTTIGALALALALTGCAAGRLANDQGFDPTLVRRPDAHQPNVFVGDDGRLVVDQEPIRVPRSEGRITIVWALAHSGSFSFPDDGIRIADSVTHQPPPGIDCAPQGSARKLYRCSYPAPLEPRRYKYAIKVNGATSALDPWIYND